MSAVVIFYRPIKIHNMFRNIITKLWKKQHKIKWKNIFFFFSKTKVIKWMHHMFIDFFMSHFCCGFLKNVSMYFSDCSLNHVFESFSENEKCLLKIVFIILIKGHPITLLKFNYNVVLMSWTPPNALEILT